MNTIGMGVLIIGAATYLAVAGALAFRKLNEKSNADFEEIHSMADPMLNVIATLFSILLGFLVAASMDSYSDTQDQCEQEALKLSDIHSLARGMDDAHRKPIQAACIAYCDAVINDEWALLAQHKSSPLVWKANRKIWDLALLYAPHDERETDLHESLIDAVRGLGECRRTRIVVSRSAYSPALWIVVLGGSIILIACTYMFFIRNPRLQAIMIAMVALSLILNVALLAVYTNPFSGDLRIKPDAFKLDQETFGYMEKQPSLEIPRTKASDD